MKTGFDPRPWARGVLAPCALVLLGACGNGGHRPDAAGASNPDCLPSFQARGARTMGAPVVRTGRAGLSPPAASLPPAKTGPAAGTHVVALRRLPPRPQNCPPPATAPAPRSG